MKNLLIASILLSVLGCASSSSSIVDSEVLKNQTIDLTKNDLSEYIVFGNVGLGWGCRTSGLYLYAGDQLYADTTNGYCKNAENYRFQGYKLSATEKAKAEQIVQKIKNHLSTLKDDGQAIQTIGCPGCADGGMLYVQVKTSKSLKAWRLDDMIDTHQKLIVEVATIKR